jgi:hypothetical protein
MIFNLLSIRAGRFPKTNSWLLNDWQRSKKRRTISRSIAMSCLANFISKPTTRHFGRLSFMFTADQKVEENINITVFRRQRLTQFVPEVVIIAYDVKKSPMDIADLNNPI